MSFQARFLPLALAGLSYTGTASAQPRPAPDCTRINQVLNPVLNSVSDFSSLARTLAGQSPLPPLPPALSTPTTRTRTLGGRIEGFQCLRVRLTENQALFNRYALLTRVAQYYGGPAIGLATLSRDLRGDPVGTQEARITGRPADIWNDLSGLHQTVALLQALHDSPATQPANEPPPDIQGDGGAETHDAGNSGSVDASSDRDRRERPENPVNYHWIGWGLAAALGIGLFLSRRKVRALEEAERLNRIRQDFLLTGEVAYLPELSSGTETTYMLGREGDAPNLVRLIQSPVDSDRKKISMRHAEIRVDSAGKYFIRDAGSTNHTYRLVEDNFSGNRHMEKIGKIWVPLNHGDVLQLGTAIFRWQTSRGFPRLERGRIRFRDANPSFLDVIRSVQEEPLLDRLEAARIDGKEREIFIRDAIEKRAGIIQRIIPSKGGGPLVVLDNGETILIADILTIRGRKFDDDLTPKCSRLISPQHPQFNDKSVNCGTGSTRDFSVLVDFADPRVDIFLKTYIDPIYQRLRDREISEYQAATLVWDFVRKNIPYDQSRIHEDHMVNTPDELYRLGEFLETGVCNERAMIIQIVLQYLGILSTMEAGKTPFPGTRGRHAWVRASLLDNLSTTVEVILDPQINEVLRRGIEEKFADYRSDYVRFKKSKLDTRVIDAL